MASTPDTVVVYMKRVAGGFEETTATLAEIGVSPEVHDGILARIAKLQKLYGVPDRVFKGVAYTPGLTSDYDNFTKRLTFSTNGLGGTWKAAEQAVTDHGYSVNVSDRGLSSLIDHEYAHAVDAHVKQSLDDDGFAAWKAAKEDLRKRLGDPSEYSKTNLGEWFAERFALEQGGGTDQRTLLVEGVGRFREDYLGDKGMRERLAAAKPPAGRSPAPVTQTINEAYRDAALRHQIDLRRYTAGVTKRVARLQEEADRDLTERLRTRLARFEGRDLDFTGERWKALLTDIRGARAAALAEYKTLVRDELGQLAVLEGQAEIDLLQSSITIEVGFMAVNADQLRAIATSRPFQGRFLRDWFSTLEAVDQQRLTTALQLGMTNGEPIDDIVRRVVGTRKNAYADGILSMTRRDAQGIVRTAVNHVSNTARGYVWDANSDIITAKVWVSTLDGRTTAVCRARDGHGTPVGDNDLPADIPPLQPEGAKPPAHFNCRSVMVAYIDGVGLLGNRPTVTDTRTRAKREIDFRRMAKEQGKPIQDIRKAWAAENVGRVPAATTYQDFLKRQPASFQDEVLGKTKAKLFREGGLNVDQFVDRAGNELTMSQLAERKPDAFRKAGLDPEKF